MSIDKHYRLGPDGSRQFHEFAPDRHKARLNTMAVFTFEIAYEIDSLEQDGTIEENSDLKKALKLFYNELEKLFS